MSQKSFRKKRIKLSESQNHRCAYCGTKTWIYPLDEKEDCNTIYDQATIDHVVCKNLGGSDHIDNLVMACHSCNLKKDSIYDAYEFYFLMGERI